MPSIPEEIIIRSLQKNASSQELEILNAWLKEDKNNVEYYFQLEEIWLSGEKLPEKIIEKGWDRLSVAIEDRPELRTAILPVKTKTFIWLRYVAAIFIGVLISSVIWMSLPTEQEKQQEIVQNVIFNHTGTQSVTLPDESTVWMNENTRIRYPEIFATTKREISLEGKAYFDIRKNLEKRFIVHVGHIEIEVTGTEFFIESVSNEKTFVTLLSGSVNLNYKDDEGKILSSTPLIPGQQAVVNKFNGELKITEVDTSYYSEWKDGTYRFNDEPLATIAQLVSQRFDVDIQISAPLRTKRFTGRITSEERIEDVLVSLGKSYPIKYRITGRNIQITTN